MLTREWNKVKYWNTQNKTGFLIFFCSHFFFQGNIPCGNIPSSETQHHHLPLNQSVFPFQKWSQNKQKKKEREKNQSIPFPLCPDHCNSNGSSYRSPEAGSCVHHSPRPGLVLGARGQVCDGHLHSLDLLVFGGYGADFVADLISLDWDILSLDAGEKNKTSQLNQHNTVLFSSNSFW